MSESCATCGSEFKPKGIASGYAVTAAGSRICYACADRMQVDEMRDRSQPFTAYLAGDGLSVTTWTGGKLATVVRKTRAVEPFGRSGSGTRINVRIRDQHGAGWYGSGEPHMAINLRPLKGEP